MSRLLILSYDRVKVALSAAASAAAVVAAGAVAVAATAAAKNYDKDDHPSTAVTAKKTIVTHNQFLLC